MSDKPTLRRSVRKTVPSKRIYDDDEFKDNSKFRFAGGKGAVQLNPEEK